jgi:Ala-tRNA(Pro) deacylase
MAELVFQEREVLRVLQELGIPFARHEHPPVYTVAEAELHWEGIKGAHCKNLFLRNQKGNRHFLVVLEHKRRLDMRHLGEILQVGRLSFASDERLARYLGLTSGAVSAFGLINDRDREVEVILDESLNETGEINFHPNVNTATLTIAFGDFLKFLAWTGHLVRYVRLGD